MKRIAIDSHVVDYIADTPSLLPRIQAAAVVGYLVILTTHIQRDELEKTKDLDRRAHLLSTYDALPKQEIPTRGAKYGISKYGRSTYGDGSASGVSLEAVTTSGRGGSHDALTGTTASGDADVLVTEDRGLRKKMEANKARCELWTNQDFRAFLEQCEREQQEGDDATTR